MVQYKRHRSRFSRTSGRTWSSAFLAPTAHLECCCRHRCTRCAAPVLKSCAHGARVAHLLRLIDECTNHLLARKLSACAKLLRIAAELMLCVFCASHFSLVKPLTRFGPDNFTESLSDG